MGIPMMIPTDRHAASKSWSYRWTKRVVAYTGESWDVKPRKDADLGLKYGDSWSFVGSKQNAH